MAGRPLPFPGRSYNGAVIDRDKVLHIARLARLRLSEEEVERMAEELSGILEHVEAIGGLDLDGVEPTTHVVMLENVLRPDEPVPSLDRDRALAGAPDSAAGSFRVPSPQA
jgi:aspartyl-tRNA(Asn)/glutamyl-tRNA(Gln) amidotransferase subunit C